MSDNVTRRDAFKALATGAAGAAMATGAREAQARQDSPGNLQGTLPLKPAAADPYPSESTMREIAQAVQRMDAADTLPENNPACLALVLHARSHSRQVYLYANDQVRGFATLNPEAFAIAVAAQSRGQRLAMRYWGHQPRANGGAGQFEGAALAVDMANLSGDLAGPANLPG